ncbi:MAG: hypothetical protein ACOX0O_09390 [Candidatus Methanoculleus thermohydrogenotrophicum]
MKKILADRVHDCPYCGFTANRDYNAAVHTHRVGVEQPVETIPLHRISVTQVLSTITGKPRTDERGVVHQPEASISPDT